LPKIKKAPAWLKSSFLIKLYQSIPGVVLSNWLAQCMLYAEPVEILFKLSLELTIFIFIGGVYWGFADFSFLSIIFIALITHTITFFVNGHFFALGRFFGIVDNEPKPFIDYPDGIRKRLANKKCIIAFVMFGSLSREKFSPSSDLDIRIIASDGFINNFKACFLLFIERFRALLNKYPLDAYVVTKEKGLEKLSIDEPPIVLFDKEGFIPNQYRMHFEYDEFRKLFLEKYHYTSS